MLICKSNYFKEMINKPVTDEMLKKLYDNLIKVDYVNFQGNISKGFYPKAIREKILELMQDKNKEEKIVLINDISLHLYNDLLNLGFKNIYLVFGKWVKQNNKMVADDNDSTYEIMNLFLKSNFNQSDDGELNIISLREFLSMKKEFDIIISNPPYAIGNEITKSIIDNVAYKQFINLMPVSKYKKGSIYKWIDKVIVLPIQEQLWDDALTNPHICILNDNKNHELSWDEIQITTYDQKWRKYYEEQIRRKESWETSFRNNVEHPCNRTFYLTIRTGVDGVHSTKDNFDYKYNIIESFNDLDLPTKGSTGSQGIYNTFKTENEKINIVSFWYNSKIMTSIVRGLNKQSLSRGTGFLPKVDWTHAWTDEKILRDYGYTEEEIKGILK